jgi:hypothetical protein
MYEEVIDSLQTPPVQDTISTYIKERKPMAKRENQWPGRD